MFTVYHSNQLDILKTLAAWLMKQKPLRDPFKSEVILVQSPGMAQWLQIALAEEFGIAANITFPLPATFIWDMFVRVLPDIPAESAFSKGSMSWKLMALLPGMLKEQAFEPLRHYLQDDDDQRKLFQLSSRIADLFDQYLVYRADWLSQWQKGETVDGLDEAQQWQAPLWQALVKYTHDIGQPEWHRASLYRRFIQTLESSSQCPEGLPERIFICGISALPPVYLQSLQALGQHIDIHLLFTNPCQYYWGDIQDHAFLAKLHSRRRRHYLDQKERGVLRDPDRQTLSSQPEEPSPLTQPLLASWGKAGRDNLYLLTQLEAREIEAFVEISPDNLLHAVQHDLLELHDPTTKGTTEQEFVHSQMKRPLNAQDRTISFHLCHSPLREVEVLQDHLLSLLAADPTLTARDIVVMVADIDAYTPYIQAVFGNAPAGRHLPFAISDRRATQSHPVISAFISLLSLNESRFASEEVLALLEVSALAKRFDIDQNSLWLLRRWVAESGIRWGLDDDNVQALALPATGQHTWRFGITRMLLGYAMQTEQGGWEGILPFDESHGLIAELVGHLAELLAQLSAWRHRLSRQRGLTEWLPLCRELLASFFITEEDSEAALALIEEQWFQTLRHGIDIDYTSEIPLTILRDELVSRLDQQRISQRFLAGSVNFCTLMPMRSIPFRIICLLGMNDGAYPRTLSPLGFDLMSKKPAKGDRSRRDDDRYLFLEALLSAREKLYLSYVGRDIQDNTERYPSVLVTELLDYLSHSFYLEGDEQLDVDASAQNVAAHLLQHHTRMPFDAENFMPSSGLVSFASEWLPAARGSGRTQAEFIQPLKPLVTEQLTIEQLIRFWRHPVSAFFQLRLGVGFGLEKIELPDSEPFELNALEKYQINVALLNAQVEGEDTAILFEQYRAAGALPYGAFGEMLWQAQQHEMQTLAEQILQYRKASQNQEVDLVINGIRLEGWLSQIQEDGLVRWRPGVLNFKDGLALWLEHLSYCAMGGTGTSRMFGRSGSTWCFTAMPPERAKEILTKYVIGYQQGLSQPLLLFLKSAGAWLKGCYDAQTRTLSQNSEIRSKAIDKLLGAWNGDYQHQGEKEDLYIQRLVRTLSDDMINEICCQAELWLLPLLQENVSI